MKLILFSTEDSKNDVSRLEKTSAAAYHSFHVRKPNWSSEELELYINALPSAWKEITVLHAHFELCEKYNLKGIHLNEKNRRYRSEVQLFSSFNFISFYKGFIN